MNKYNRFYYFKLLALLIFLITFANSKIHGVADKGKIVLYCTDVDNVNLPL
jgi:hypothetical protein